jgi:uncharacterized membrane protein YbhN (UPF0104 family)
LVAGVFGAPFLKPAHSPVKGFPFKPLLLVLAASAACYAIVLWVFGERSTFAILQRLWSPLGWQAAALCCVNYGLRGLRWRMWMAQYQRPLGLVEGMRLYLAGYTFTPTPGNIGEAARGLLLARNPLSPAQSLALFGAERLADLLCLILLCLPLAGWLIGIGGLSDPRMLERWWPIGLLLPVVVAATFTLRARWLAALRGSWVQEAWRCLSVRAPVWFTLTLVAWVAQGTTVWLLCRDAGLDLALLQACGVYAVAMVGGALSFLPAGLGGTEALMSGLLVLHGASTAQALGITVLARLLTLWLAVAIGALALVYSAVVCRDISFK